MNRDDNTEVLRITKDGIWVNPDLSVDDAAKAVLGALDAQIKTLVQRAVEDERERCLQKCMAIAHKPSNVVLGVALECAEAIRRQR